MGYTLIFYWSFLPQSPGYVFLLLGSTCTVCLAAEKGLRTLFLWLRLGKKFWFLSHKAQIHAGFIYTGILYTLEILVTGRMTKNTGGTCTDACLGMIKKLPYCFWSVFSGRITYINSHPVFYWMCEKRVNPETCIFSMILWLCWKLVLCCPYGQTQALVPHRINQSCFSMGICMSLVQVLWCQLDDIAY